MMEEQQGKWKRITLWVIGIVAALAVVYDVFVAFFNTEKHDTISRVVQSLAYHSWSFPYAFGAVFIGHFFLNGRPVLPQPWAWLSMLGGFGALLALDLTWISFRLHPLVFLSVGILAGRLFWPLTAPP